MYNYTHMYIMSICTHKVVSTIIFGCMWSRDYLVLSEFTAALFEDSGWYKANYSALSALDQHTLQWGKGMDNYTCKLHYCF